MNWGYFLAWVVSIFVLFFVTGWPVSPSLQNVWGNQYYAKNLTYYGVLYIHYLLGPLFFTFLGLGLVRNWIWKSFGARQLTFLLAYATLLAACVAVYLTHRYAPLDDTTVEMVEMAEEANTTKADDDINYVTTTDNATTTEMP